MTTLFKSTYRFLSYLIFISFVIILGAFLFFAYWPMSISNKGDIYYLKPGAHYTRVTNELYQKQLIRHPLFFQGLLYLKNAQNKLKSGEYFIKPGTNPVHLIDQFTSGTGMVYHAFTIIPGTTFTQLRNKLNENPFVKHTSQSLNNLEIMEKIAATGEPEGQFFPETYLFVYRTSDMVILKNAYLAMQKKLNAAWQNRAKDLPYKSPYEALIAASIIEKETALDAEKPIIASVMVNRLSHDFLLQFDPTVIYGLGDQYQGKIPKEDLVKDTPFNTYVRKGLPPTPISFPSLPSIQASLQPAKTDYFYFVASARGGEHQFSRTLGEHNKAVMAVLAEKLKLTQEQK